MEIYFSQRVILYKEVPLASYMGMQTAIMAVPCTKCGQLFDLSYDLERASTEWAMEDVIQALPTKRTSRKTLCWDCRK